MSIMLRFQKINLKHFTAIKTMTKKKVSKKTKKKTANTKAKAVKSLPSKDIFSSPINEIGPYKASFVQTLVSRLGF